MREADWDKETVAVFRRGECESGFEGDRCEIKVRNGRGAVDVNPAGLQ